MKDYKMIDETFMARNHCLKEFTENKTLMFKIRSFVYKKFGVWDLWDILPYRWSMWYYDKLKPIFKPKHARLRKAIPRQWCDITSLIVDVNFEFIKTFYEEEYVDGIVDWSATEHHQEFATWLERTYIYILNERPELEKQKDEAYPKRDGCLFDNFEEITDEQGRKLYKFKETGVSYEVSPYGEVSRLEKLIEDKDTEILTQLIKRREYFWT